MRFRILGPVEIRVDEGVRSAGAAKERCLLAALLLTPGDLIPASTLITRLWGDEPPERARDSLYTYMTRLRHRLEDSGLDATVVSKAGMYGIRVSPEDVDLHQFRRHRAQARALADDGERNHAVLLLQEADAIWRGRPLHDVPGAWADRTRTTLTHERVDAVLERAAITTALGRPNDVIDDLTKLIDSNPYNEAVVRHLMTALQVAGRPAEALHAYEQMRRRLADDLGTDPGPKLQTIHQRILRGQPAEQHPNPPASVVNNLPRDLADFTGRTQELRQVLTSPPEGATGVITITGPPGAGKTSLAIHAAHQLRRQYPDGQIFLRLHAYDHDRSPMKPAAGLDALLRLAGLTTDQIPRSTDARAALWRNALGGKRILLVLDDAANVEQVQSLLPGSPSALVIVTSRRRLAGLDAAQRIPLGPLPEDDSVRMFTRAAQIGDVDNPEIINIIRLCGRLPLAIRIAGARLLHRPAWTPRELLTRLEDHSRRLTELSIDSRSVGAAIELSYRELNERTRTALHRLAAHPGQDITADAAAALLDQTPTATERILETLLDHHLIDEPVRNRFRLHDLVYEYIRSRAEFSPSEALERLAGYYTAAIDGADRRLRPYRRHLPSTQVPVNPPSDSTRGGACAWLDSERATILSIGRSNVVTRHSRALIAHVCASALDSWGDHAQAVELHAIAIEYWNSSGDVAARALALADRAFIYWRMGNYSEAASDATNATKLYQSIDDQLGIADMLNFSSLVSWHKSEFDESLALSTEALNMYVNLDNRYGQAEARLHSGIALWHLGQYDEALAEMRKSLEIYAYLDDPTGLRNTHNNIGDIERHQGNPESALRHYKESLKLMRQVGGKQSEAILLNNIGSIYLESRQYGRAVEQYRAALTIYRAVGDRRNIADATNNLAAAQLGRGQAHEALDNYHRAREIACTLADGYEQAIADCGAGDALHTLARWNDAAASYDAALERAQSIADPYLQARALAGLGHVARSQDQIEAARTRLLDAKRLYRRIGLVQASGIEEEIATMTA